MKKPNYVVDSYALMAYLGGEAEAEQVKALLRQGQRNEATIWSQVIQNSRKLNIW